MLKKKKKMANGRHKEAEAEGGGTAWREGGESLRTPTREAKEPRKQKVG
jgi:hypothetical protein